MDVMARYPTRSATQLSEDLADMCVGFAMIVSAPTKERAVGMPIL